VVEASPWNTAWPSLLLGEQSHVEKLSSQCLDFQERMVEFGVRREALGDDPVPAVLLMTRAADAEMDELSLLLAERGVRVARLDSDRCADVRLTMAGDGVRMELGGVPFAPRLVWRRHFDLDAIPRSDDALTRAHLRNQWDPLSRWAVTRRDWDVLNRGVSTLDRLGQLAHARRCGFTTPRTVVGNRLGRAAELIGGDRFVVKTFGSHWLETAPGELHGLFPRTFSREELTRAPDEPAPVMVQEYVAARDELRIFVIEDRLIGFRVAKKSAEQLWTDPDDVAVEPTEIPEKLHHSLRLLAAAMRLDVAAFDLLVVGDDHVFLEVNVSGDWNWFERRGGGPAAIPAAVTDLVVRRFEEAAC
jgi:hypothetical protein